MENIKKSLVAIIVSSLLILSANNTYAEDDGLDFLKAFGLDLEELENTETTSEPVSNNETTDDSMVNIEEEMAKFEEELNSFGDIEENIDLSAATYTNEAMYADYVITDVETNNNLNNVVVSENTVASNNNQNNTVEVTRLPQTGPTEIILLLISLLMTGAIYFYKRKTSSL